MSNMKYEVINQAVEINGVTRKVGDIVDESEFKPLEEPVVQKEEVPEIEPDVVLDELDSLLKTHHIKIIN